MNGSVIDDDMNGSVIDDDMNGSVIDDDMNEGVIGFFGQLRPPKKLFKHSVCTVYLYVNPNM
jgi:hypothetical protein